MQQADLGNAGQPNHNNKVVVEDWYSDDELLTQYVSDRGFPCFSNEQCCIVLELLL
jgi:hypothetical protein